MKISVYTDGGARGNPGPAGFGLVIYDDHKKIIYQESTFLGTKTNNEAEYSGLIAALIWINNNKENFNLTEFEIFSDSQLLVRQIQGKYKVKAQNLKIYYLKVMELLDYINLKYNFKDIRRERNILADELANQAMDKAVLP